MMRDAARVRDVFAMNRRAIRFALALLFVAAGVGICNADCAGLHALAQSHAQDMARRNSLDHSGFMRNRVAAGAIAENVAVGCDTEACARRMWMQSAPHRRNMMLGGCQAVASAVSANGRRYWAMEIGDNRPVSTARVAPARGNRKGGGHDGLVGRDFSVDGGNTPY